MIIESVSLVFASWKTKKNVYFQLFEIPQNRSLSYIPDLNLKRKYELNEFDFKKTEIVIIRLHLPQRNIIYYLLMKVVDF